jgi:Mn2+/Fe2+ NRAMP family transporter
MNLAQACRQLLPGRWRIPLWLLAEVAIIACDLAELVGQVVLSLQVPFAVIPLVWICGRAGAMGPLRTPRWLQGVGWGCAAVIVLFTVSLLVSTVSAHLS